MTRVLRLADPRATDTVLCGDDMSLLARLAGVGAPVPPGFVVTTECGPLDDPEAEAAVFRAYDALGDGHGTVPVVEARTSPTGGGTAASSGAGVLATVRDIGNLADLLGAIRTCRGADGPERAGASVRGAAGSHLAVGVVQTIRSDLSGVAYTACPLGTDRLMVESVRGTLSSLRDGSVIPEHLQLVPGLPVVAKRLIGEDGPDLLGEAEVALVRETCVLLGEILGGDVAVEWSMADGRLTVLSVQRMVGLTSAASEHGASSRPGRRWLGSTVPS
jgi:phosphoenolpyruvate synthase/pyruvate phosphate dikinase